MDVTTYIVEKGLILIPVLLIIGNIIKNLTIIPDKYIPLGLLLLSLLFTPGVLGSYSADNLVQSVLITGVAVFANQLHKQTLKKEEN